MTHTKTNASTGAANVQHTILSKQVLKKKKHKEQVHRGTGGCVAVVKTAMFFVFGRPASMPVEGRAREEDPLEGRGSFEGRGR